MSAETLVLVLSLVAKGRPLFPGELGCYSSLRRARSPAPGLRPA